MAREQKPAVVTGGKPNGKATAQASKDANTNNSKEAALPPRKPPVPVMSKKSSNEKNDTKATKSNTVVEMKSIDKKVDQISKNVKESIVGKNSSNGIANNRGNNNNKDNNNKRGMGSKASIEKTKKIVYEEEEEDDDDDEEEEDEEVSEDGSSNPGETSQDDEEDDEEGDEDDDEDNESEEEDDDDEEEDDDEDEFEQQSSDDELISEHSEALSDEDLSAEELRAEAMLLEAESKARGYGVTGNQRHSVLESARKDGTLALQQHMHLDDLSSDDEDNENNNTIGRVPLHWYDAYDHIGYNMHGQKIVKRNQGDSIDQVLNSNDPIARRTVYDMYNDREVVLSDRDLEIIRRIQAGAYAHPEFDDTPEYVDYFSSEKEVMPLSAAPEPKRRFLPSKWEMMRVMKIVKAIKEGKYVDLETLKQQKLEAIQQQHKDMYLAWNDAEDEILAETKKNQYHLPAPKMPLPGHAESYNPPSEYLLTNEEKKDIEDMDPTDRPYNFIPQQYKCLRHVPGYDNFVKERFERCLDLYLCPRKLKKRLNIDPETLMPRLPKPRDLKPFPTTICLQMLGHRGAVRSLSVSLDGQYLVSGGDDGTVRLWESDTGLCRFTWQLNRGPVTQVAWNPNPSHDVIIASVGRSVVVIVTGLKDGDANEVTEALLSGIADAADKNSSSNSSSDDFDARESDGEEEVDDEDEGGDKKTPNKKYKMVGKWIHYKEKKSAAQQQSAANITNSSTNSRGVAIGPRYELVLHSDISVVAWHYKGDYMSTLSPLLGSQAVAVHQLSKASSQCPFNKSPGKVQSVAFHPTRPFLFVATQQHIKVYHLIEQKLVKKLMSGCKWLSSMDIHYTGDHILVGSYDRRMAWFDMDLASTPYKTLKFHEKAIRSVQFHKRYPLMASSSDDGTVHIFHSMVYDDLTKSPLIVPVKILRGHGVKGDLGVLQAAFHPKQPWIFTSGVDGVINLFQDL